MSSESAPLLAALLAEQRAQLAERETAHAEYLASAPRGAWDGWWGLWHYQDGAYHSVRFVQDGNQLTARWQGADRIYVLEGNISESGLLCIAATCHSEDEEGERIGFVGPLTMEMGRAGCTIQMNWDWARLYPKGTDPRVISRALPEIFAVYGADDAVWAQLCERFAATCCCAAPTPGGKGYAAVSESSELTGVTVTELLAYGLRAGLMLLLRANGSVLADVQRRRVPLHLATICLGSEVAITAARDPAAVATEEEEEAPPVVTRVALADGLHVQEETDAGCVQRRVLRAEFGKSEDCNVLRFVMDGQDEETMRIAVADGLEESAKVAALLACDATHRAEPSEVPDAPFQFGACCFAADTTEETVERVAAALVRANPQVAARPRSLDALPVEAPPSAP
eukprot:Hpha_TRINITY_DN8611_c0_g1::TRINITY_DN8611_c0_g1_i1::g.168596::m.168596